MNWMTDAVRQWADDKGYDIPGQAWISSPYDSWERNPWYHGPAVDHPEYQDMDAIVIQPMKIETMNCSFNRGASQLIYSFPNGNFPREVEVFSPHSGRAVLFIQDAVAAERNEYWDGEMMQYYPDERLDRVETLVFTRGY